MARRRGFFRTSRRRRAPRLRRMAHRAKRGLGIVRGFTSRVGRAFPVGLKPSRITAYTGIATGLVTLVGTPLAGSNDSWFNRVIYAVDAVKAGQPMSSALIGTDGANPLSVLGQQLQQNAPAAIGTTVGFGIGAAILSYFGL